MTTVTDIEAQLVEVRAAISRVLTMAQGVNTAGRDVEFAKLDQLNKREEMLLARLATAQGKATGKGHTRIYYVATQ